VGFCLLGGSWCFFGFAMLGGSCSVLFGGPLAFPCFVSGLLALPLCGAALTFFAAAKKDKQRKRLKPLVLKRVPRTVAVVVHLESVASHIPL
jgi:LytS/YehU family sensor histidine kinase